MALPSNSIHDKNEQNLDDRALHEIEDGLQTKIYPGTEIMVDVGNHHFVKSRSKKGSAPVLVPQPSDDPHDPLNWSSFWKTITIICTAFVTVSQTLGPLANAPLFEEYMHEWDISLATAVEFTGNAILVLGFSNLLWVPMATCIGRRPVMIVSTIMCACTCIWRARATSSASFMGASIVNGFASGPCESIMPTVVSDIIFLHDRGKYQTLYFTLYFGSLMLGNVIAGVMAQHTGWRSFWWFNTGLLFLSFFLNLFFFPETRYTRKSLPQETQPAEQNSGDEQSDKHGVVNHEESHRIEDPNDPWLGRGKPSRKQFMPYSAYEGSIVKQFCLPFYLFAFPIIQFAGFVVSFSASGFLIANLTQQQFFGAPPYNFSVQSVGFTSLALLAGGMIGLLSSGPLSDWVADYLTRRNNGIREPEMRLIALIPYTIVMILGCVIVAVGYDRQWPWQVTIIIGYSLLGMQVTSLPSIAATYAVDSYKPATGSIFVTITINKNLWGYGFSKFVTAWSVKSGYIPPLLTDMGLIIFFCSFGILFWFRGKWFRGLSKNSFIHKLET